MSQQAKGQICSQSQPLAFRGPVRLSEEQCFPSDEYSVTALQAGPSRHKQIISENAF